jgi:nucleoside-diphosphate kinase
VGFDHANTQGVGIANIIHASGDPDEAKAEIAHWFSEAELYDYQALHEKYTQPGKNKK